MLRHAVVQARPVRLTRSLTQNARIEQGTRKASSLDVQCTHYVYEHRMFNHNLRNLNYI